MMVKPPFFLGTSPVVGTRIRHALGALCLIVFVLNGLPGLARANELDDFHQALRAYEEQNYSLATSLFEALVGGDQAKLQNRALLLESRKYLAASYLFLGLREKAVEQFERLLLDDPSYQLDPLAFPEEVQKTFSEVRSNFEQVEKVQRTKEEKKTRAEKVTIKKKEDSSRFDRNKIQRVMSIAETERVERLHSRWIALIPFGVGQFQNGDRGWGTFFVISEGLAAAVNIASYFLHQGLKGKVPNSDELGKARFLENAFCYTNWGSLALLGGLAVGGIIDAEVRFRPDDVETRKRVLPEDLRNILKVSVGVSGVAASVNF
jgi:tetratricopeptide (TPR) repeat protein